MAEKKVYKIRLHGALVEVTEEIYLTYYRMARRDRAQKERDTYNGSFSYDALDTDELLGEELLSDRNAVSVEDAAIANILRDKLHCCLALLPQTEQDLLYALYFEGLSERKYAESLGISQKAVNKRRHRILGKLRSMMKI